MCSFNCALAFLALHDAPADCAVELFVAASPHTFTRAPLPYILKEPFGGGDETYETFRKEFLHLPSMSLVCPEPYVHSMDRLQTQLENMKTERDKALALIQNE
jgi:hypothetical protein